MKRRHPKKLILTSVTLRHLQHIELSQAIGANNAPRTGPCGGSNHCSLVEDQLEAPPGC